MSKGIYNKIQEHLKGYSPQGCVIESPNSIFIPFQYDSETETGICVTYYTPDRENVWSAGCWGQYYRSQCNITTIPEKQFILVGWHGDVIAQHGFKESGAPNFIEEKSIPLLKNCPIMHIRNIEGKAYIAANWRTIFRRDGIDNWTLLHGNDPSQIETWQKENRDLGFNDIGGFSEKDIYACGGQGDLWHFDGTKWKEIDLPTNIELKSLCCAPNGKVYIGCENGVLITGRDNSWEVLNTKAANINITDMTWYKDELYLACGMYGLYVYDMNTIKPAKGISSLGETVATERSIHHLDDNTKEVLATTGADKDTVEVVEAIAPTESILAPASLHSLSTDGEVLLAAGTDKVVAFDGVTWKVLFAPFGLDIGGEL